MLVHSAFEHHLEASYVWDVFIIDARYSYRHACTQTSGQQLVFRTTQVYRSLITWKRRLIMIYVRGNITLVLVIKKNCHSVQEIGEDYKFSMSSAH